MEDQVGMARRVTFSLRRHDPSFVVDGFPRRVAAEAALAASRCDLLITNIERDEGETARGIMLIEHLLDSGAPCPVVVHAAHCGPLYPARVSYLHAKRGLEWSSHVEKHRGKGALIAMVCRVPADRLVRLSSAGDCR
jgi:hypothetical protein